MTKLPFLSIAAAVAIALAACAQNDTQSDDTMDRTASTSSTSSTTEPSSSTSDTSTATSDTSTASTTPDSSSSSTSSAGTMESDSSTAQTDPRSTSGGVASADPTMSAAPVVVGLQVETATGESLGTVVEIVADAATGAPLFAVISADGASTAVPYTAAASMVQDDALVMDRAKLAAAPHVEQGEWRQAGEWTGEASGYWGEGETRTATPGTGTEPAQSEQPKTEESPTRY